MSLQFFRTLHLQSLACALAIFLVAAGCGKRDDTKTARTDPPAPPASAAEQTVAAMQTVARDASKAQASAEATFQQCLKRQSQTGEANEKPPTDVNGFYPTPNDCVECAKDWWRTNQPTALRSQPNDEATETVSLPSNVWVQVLEDVALTKPTRGVVVAPGGGLQACEVVYSIHTEFDEGEHVHDRVWHSGKLLMVGIESDVPEDEGTDGRAKTESARAIVRFDEPPVSGFSDNRWVKLRWPGGSTGWAHVQPDSFNCMWTNDRYLNDRPTICATPPSLPVEHQK